MNKHSESVKWSGFSPFQLLSLFDMIRVQVDLLQIHLNNLRQCTESLFNETLEQGRNLKMGDFKAKLFVCIPTENAKYYEQDDIFGIKAKFKIANEEAKLAGNCFATGNYTACVFHLMRVTEHGLRKVARQLEVPFPAKYELKTWEGLLRDIECKVSKIVELPKSPKRQKKLKYFNPIPLQFRFFKDAWRNHVMHCRAEYDEDDAKRIMRHVEEMMRNIVKGR